MDRAQRAVEQWRKERPDINCESMIILGRLGQLNQLLSQKVLNPFFAENGLQPGEFDVLATLRRSGKPFALTPTVLYEDAMISSGSMTNRIDRLVKLSLVERYPNPKDKRGTLVGLTDKGYDLIDNLVQTHADNQQKVLSVLEPQQQEQLSALLLALIDSIEPKT